MRTKVCGKTCIVDNKQTWMYNGIAKGAMTATMEEHIMPIEGYVEYQRREYCKDIRCPVQLELDASVPGSDEYERIRAICQQACRHTTYEFHHWLIEKGYLLVRPDK